MTEDHAVVIAGGGPAGLMLAAELTLAGVDVVIVERRTSRTLEASRGGGLHARTLEVLDQRGIVERFLEAGTTAQVSHFGTTLLDISDLPTRHPYGLALWQNRSGAILAGWVLDDLAAPIRRGVEVTGFAQDDDGVWVQLSDGGTLRSRYLVGCDGSRSVVRKTAGIDFPGWEATSSSIIAEVQLADEPQWGVHHDERGTHGFGRLEDGRVRLVCAESTVGRAGELGLADLSAALREKWGTDYGAHSPTWIARFTDGARQAAAYRAGRVLLAGDAAHVHSPVGGQGMGLGVQDAVNLGWKLAAVIHGTAPDSLLDSYQAERHPVAARAIRYTFAQATLMRVDARIEALREAVDDLLGVAEAQRRVGARVAGLDIHHDLGEGHPLLGRRMPDLDLRTGSGRTLRVFTLLHDARPVLLDLAGPGAAAVTVTARPWEGRVQIVHAHFDGAWDLPGLGTVPAPTAALVRPDGYVAWVGEGTDEGLVDALTTWFGTP